MKFKFLRMKSAGVLVCAAGLIGSPFAQTRTLVTPADSVGAGGKMLSALDGFCTSTNNRCVTSATLPGLVEPLIPTPTPTPTPVPTTTQGSICGQVVFTGPTTATAFAPAGTIKPASTSELHCNGTSLSLSFKAVDQPIGIANCPIGYQPVMTGKTPGAVTTGGQTSKWDGSYTIYYGDMYFYSCLKS